MTEAVVAASAGRRRNTILESLELFRAASAPRSFSSFVLFLYACENEGLTFSELAELAGMSVASASRIIRSMVGSLAAPECGIDPPLLAVDGSPTDRRLKALYLTEEGRALRDALELMIAAARPIRPAI